MIRQAITNIFEASKMGVKVKHSWEDFDDFVNGEYENLDQYLSSEHRIEGTYNSKEGTTIYQVSSSEKKKLEGIVKKFGGVIEEVDAPVDFGKIMSKKDFDKLTSSGKIALVYNWLSGQTDIQPSNIHDLVVSVTNKKAVFTSNSVTVDTGKYSISGMEDLPFGLSFSELKKIAKEVFNLR